MGKYAGLTNGLMVQGKQVQSVCDALVEADGRAFRALVNALLTHPNDDKREMCAEIFGKRSSTKAIPFLIDALADDSVYLRRDAIWSIQKLSLMQTGALSEWLDFSETEPAGLREKVMKWWRLNRQFLQRDYLL